MNALDHGKVASRPRAWCRSLCTGVSPTLGYLQVTESYSSNGTFVLQVILCDRFEDVLTSSWRDKLLSSCHLTIPFYYRFSHFRRLSHWRDQVNNRPLVFMHFLLLSFHVFDMNVNLNDIKDTAFLKGFT